MQTVQRDVEFFYRKIVGLTSILQGKTADLGGVLTTPWLSSLDAAHGDSTQQTPQSCKATQQQPSEKKKKSIN